MKYIKNTYKIVVNETAKQFPDTSATVWCLSEYTTLQI